MKIFYSSDVMGKYAAYLAYYYSAAKLRSIKYIEIDYTFTFFSYLAEIRKRENVFIIGYTPALEEFEYLTKITDNVKIIDNNSYTLDFIEKNNISISAGEKKEKDIIQGYINVHMSLPETVWQFFKIGDYKTFIDRDKTQPPRCIRLLTDYHNRNFEYGDEGKWLYYALYGLDAHPSQSVYNLLLNDRYVDRLLSGGKAITDYIERYRHRIIKKYGYGIDFRGASCLIINYPECDYSWFDDKELKESYEIVASYVFNGENFTVKMWSNREEINVENLTKDFDPVGNKWVVEFIVDECEFLWLNNRMDKLFLYKLRGRKLQKPIQVTLYNVSEEGYKIGVDALDVIVEDGDFTEAKRKLAEKLYDIFIRLFDGNIPAYEINPDWTAKDIERIMNFFRAHLASTYIHKGKPTGPKKKGIYK